MKKISLTALALTFSAGTAFAADLSSRKAPIVAPPPPPMWTGFYAGLNAGGTWANSNNATITSWGVYNPPGLSIDIVNNAAISGSRIFSGNSNGGFMGGGQIGYNWQIGNVGGLGFGSGFVTGIEADIQGITNSSGNRTGYNAVVTLNGAPLSTLFNGSSSVQYIGTVRGRLGFLAMPTLLVYGTGGLAYGGVSSSVSMAQLRANTSGNGDNSLAGVTAGSYANTQVGWTAGGGLEWMFLPNWSAKAEYLYYDLGTVTYGAGVLVGYNSGNARYGIAPQVNQRFNGNIVRAGVNYHFNWGAAPVVAKY